MKIIPMSLAECRTYILEHLHKGVRCPACNQLCKSYRRSVHSTMARGLIKIYRSAGQGWVHLPTALGRQQEDETKLRHWGLLEEHDGRREDGGRAGWWRVTDDGALFVRGEHKIQKYVRIFDNEVLESYGPMVTIEDCLGEPFDYQELMNG